MKERNLEKIMGFGFEDLEKKIAVLRLELEILELLEIGWLTARGPLGLPPAEATQRGKSGREGA